MIHDKTSRRPRHNKCLQKDEKYKFEAVLHFEWYTIKTPLLIAPLLMIQEWCVNLI